MSIGNILGGQMNEVQLHLLLLICVCNKIVSFVGSEFSFSKSMVHTACRLTIHIRIPSWGDTQSQSFRT